MLVMDQKGQINILLVESCSERSSSIRQVLSDSGIPGRLHTVGDIIETLAYIRQDTPYAGAPRPDLVLFGRCLEIDCGGELLDEIRQNPRLKGLRLIALTETALTHESGEKQSVGTDRCHVEQVDLSQLVRVIDDVEADSFVTAHEVNGW